MTHYKYHKKSVIQASQYNFPYHHIPDFNKNNFLSKHWYFAASYVASMKLVSELIVKVANHEGKAFRHIDIGCGDGALLHYLVERYGIDGAHFTGMDKDINAIGWAKMMQPSIDWRMNEIHPSSPSYSSATLIEVLEHIEPKQLSIFISDSVSMVKKNGLLIITVPSNEKPLMDKHFQHFSMPLLHSIFSPFLQKIKIWGFENHNLFSRLISVCRNNPFARIDCPALNKVLVDRLSQLHNDQAGCGRLLLVGRVK
jgi:2-polyprenyl-3-methyl-5-hydroxy-6-metoxy-1,4-benzoquinol methylase